MATRWWNGGDLEKEMRVKAKFQLNIRNVS